MLCPAARVTLRSKNKEQLPSGREECSRHDTSASEVQHWECTDGGWGFRVQLPYCPSREKPEEGRGGPAGQQDRAREETTNRAQSLGTAGDVRHINELPRASWQEPEAVSTAAPGGRR